MAALVRPFVGSRHLTHGLAESKSRAFNRGQDFKLGLSNHRFVSNISCCQERSHSKKATSIKAASSATALVYGNPTDDELLQTYIPPHFSHPYPVKFHPSFSSPVYRAKFEKWLQHLKVDTIFTPKIWRMLLDMDIPAFGAGIYADAPEWGMDWACKFLFMLWVWDDTMDSTEIGKSPEQARTPLLDVHLLMLWSFPDDAVLRSKLEPFLNFFEGEAREEKVRYVESVLAEARTQPGTVYSKPTSSVLCDLYLELWKELIETATPEFCLRFAHWMQFGFLGDLQEIKTRHLKTTNPSIDDYILMRRQTSAVPIAMVIVDYVFEITSPDSWFTSPEMWSVLDALNDIVSWHNDVYSFKREVLVQKDIGNMVLANSVHRQISYTEAADLTMQMVHDRVLDLERAIKELELITPPEYRRNFEIYATASRHFVSATDDWHTNSVRYH